MVTVSRDFSHSEEFLIIFNDICINCPENNSKAGQENTMLKRH